MMWCGVEDLMEGLGEKLWKKFFGFRHRYVEETAIIQ
jgi:hypothetical protein